MSEIKHPPSRAGIISYALQLLRAGTLPSELPGKLMEEFGLSIEPAVEIAGEAVKLWKKEKPRNAGTNGGKSHSPGE